VSEQRDRATFSEGMAFGGASFAVTALVGLASSVAVARLYGASTLGELALAQAPALALAYLSTAQEQAGLVRELSVLPPRVPRVTALFAAVFAFSLGLTLVVSALAVPGAYLLLTGPLDHPELFGPSVALIASYVLLENTNWNLDMIMSAFRAGRQLFWARLVHAGTFLAVAVAAAAFTRSLWCLVLATVAGPLLALLVRLTMIGAFMRPRVGRGDLRDGARALPGMVRWGLKTAPGTALQGVAGQVAVWVMGFVTTTAAIGAYNRASQLASRLVDVNFRILEMLFPTLVERRSRSDAAGFDRAVADSLRYAAIALLLPAAVGAGAAHGIMGLFGPGFERAADAFALLLLVPAMGALSSVQQTQLWAMDRPGIVTVIAAGHTALMVALVIVLTSAHGITGAALACAIAGAAKLACTALVARRHWSSPLLALWPARELLGLALACAAGFAAARALDGSVPPGPLPALVAGAMAYLAIVAVTSRGNPRDRARLRAIWARLARRETHDREPPEVAIVVVTHDALRYCRILLRTLRRTRGVRYELVVVDNASRLPVRAYLAWMLLRRRIARLCLLDRNTLFAEGNNVGVAAASREARHVLLLNSDVEVRDPDWLRRLLDVHRRGATSLGYAGADPWPRADGYCFLVDRDLYATHGLDESFQWWWSITRLQAELLRDGHAVTAVRSHEELLHHFGGKSNGRVADADGMDTAAQTVRGWFDGHEVAVVDSLADARHARSEVAA
jgi:O-antigen/teichoic acid export membrane protein